MEIMQTTLIELYQTDYNEYSQPIIPDDKDKEIAERRLKAYDNNPEPREGDYVIMPNGSYERFSYVWPESIQTCNSGTFYLGNGYASMSGSLNSAIPKEKIQITDEKKPGEFWFFHHDFMTAHNGIGVKAVCRVYRVI
jgi:hypothetical protein